MNKIREVIKALIKPGILRKYEAELLFPFLDQSTAYPGISLMVGRHTVYVSLQSSSYYYLSIDMHVTKQQKHFCAKEYLKVYAREEIKPQLNLIFEELEILEL